MKSFLATDHKTLFVVSDDGSTIEVQLQSVCDDDQGGMDFEFRPVARYADVGAFEPGWLARDVESAAKRAEQLERERQKSARPVTMVGGDLGDLHKILCKRTKTYALWAYMGGGKCHCPDVNHCVIYYLDNFDKGGNLSQFAKAWNWTG